MVKLRSLMLISVLLLAIMPAAAQLQPPTDEVALLDRAIEVVTLEQSTPEAIAALHSASHTVPQLDTLSTMYQSRDYRRLFDITDDAIAAIAQRLEELGATHTTTYLKAMAMHPIWNDRYTERDFIRSDSIIYQLIDFINAIDLPEAKRTEWSYVLGLQNSLVTRFSQSMSTHDQMIVEDVTSFLESSPDDMSVERFTLLNLLLQYNANFNFLSANQLKSYYERASAIGTALCASERIMLWQKLIYTECYALTSSSLMATIDLKNLVEQIDALPYYCADLKMTAHYCMSISNIANGNISSSIADLEAALAILTDDNSRGVEYGRLMLRKAIAMMKIQLDGMIAQEGWDECQQAYQDALLLTANDPDSHWFMKYVFGIANIYVTSGKMAMATAMIDQLKSRAEVIAEMSDLGALDVSMAMALVGVTIGDLDYAHKMTDRAYEKAMKTAKSDSMRATYALNFSNMYYQSLGDYDAAIDALHTAIKYSNDYEKVVCYDMLAKYELGKSNFDEAIKHADTALSKIDKLPDMPPEAVINALIIKAKCLVMKRDYGQPTEELIQRAVSMLGQVASPSQRTYLTGHCYYAYGALCSYYPRRRAEAISYYRQSMSSLTAVATQMKPLDDIAAVAHELAMLYAFDGDITNARATLDDAIEMLNVFAGEMNMSYFQLLATNLDFSIGVGDPNLVGYYWTLINKRISDLRQLSSGDRTMIDIMRLRVMPALLQFWFNAMKQTATPEAVAETEESQRRVINEIEATLKANERNINPQAIWQLWYVKGHYHYMKNDMDSALVCYKNADAIYSNFDTKNMQMQVLANKGRFAEAYQLNREIMEMVSGQKGNAMNLSNRLLNEAFLLLNMGRGDDATKSAATALGLAREIVGSTFYSISATDRAALSYSSIRPIFYYSMANVLRTGAANELAYDAALMFKGALTRCEVAIGKSVAASRDTSLIAQYDELASLRQQFTVLSRTFDATDPKKVAEWGDTYNRISRLDASIASRSRAYRDVQKRNSATWRDVGKRLKRGEEAIEMVQLWDSVARGNRYAALLLEPGRKSPTFIPLPTVAQLDSLLSVDIIGESRRINATYMPQSRLRRKNRGDALYAALWAPIEAQLPDGTRRIYYSPTGRLFTVAFAALPDSSGQCLLQRYDLRMLSSTAQLLNPDTDAPTAIDRALVCGGLKYDRDTLLQRSEWKELYFSALESTQVNDLLQQAGVKTTFLGGLDVSEDFIASQSGQPLDLFQISTHGFYRDTDFEQWRKLYPGVNPFNLTPMQRSGLVLSDGNPAWHGESSSPNESDNILTANEIAQMDLTSVKLVVLSACETGLGFPDMNEGIDGLQRGFKLAGAGAIISSLWSVNDRAGFEFITSFYHKLLDSGDLHNSFRLTQLEMKEKYPNSPYMWACFVLLD